MTVVDASAKVKWVHAKVFVFTKLVYLLLCVHVQHSSQLHSQPACNWLYCYSLPDHVYLSCLCSYYKYNIYSNLSAESYSLDCGVTTIMANVR